MVKPRNGQQTGKTVPKVSCKINAAEYRIDNGVELGVSHSFGVSVGASGALPLWNRGGMFTSSSSPAESTQSLWLEGSLTAHSSPASAELLSSKTYCPFKIHSSATVLKPPEGQNEERFPCFWGLDPPNKLTHMAVFLQWNKCNKITSHPLIGWDVWRQVDRTLKIKLLQVVNNVCCRRAKPFSCSSSW